MLRGDHGDRLEPSFEDTTSPSSCAARRWMATSASSSAMRRRDSSAFSLLVRPGSWSVSIRCCRRGHVDHPHLWPDRRRPEPPGDLQRPGQGPCVGTQRGTCSARDWWSSQVRRPWSSS